MSQREVYHDAVKNALLKDGWTITHDPYLLESGLHKLYVDLGAERLIAAARGAEMIVVQVKSFVGHSEVQDLEQAVGQYVICRSLMQRRDPERTLYLALPKDAFETVLESELGRIVRAAVPLRLLVFNPREEVVEQWSR